MPELKEDTTVRRPPSSHAPILGIRTKAVSCRSDKANDPTASIETVNPLEFLVRVLENDDYERRRLAARVAIKAWSEGSREYATSCDAPQSSDSIAQSPLRETVVVFVA